MSIYDELRTALLTKQDRLHDIVGQEETKLQLKSALLMGHHVIIVGPPGIGKTTLAKNIAALLPSVHVNTCLYHCLPELPVCPECLHKQERGMTIPTQELTGKERFVRVQGSPDLTAEDLLGDIDPLKALQFGPLSLQAFTPGKIFQANNGILFFDEVNRCPEKLQNALLQVLEEKKVTIGSYQVDFPTEFIFIGTMNPEDTSTEKLSDVFIDRFDLMYMTYPEKLATETTIVKQKAKVLTHQGKAIVFPPELLSFMLSFVRYLRDHAHVEKKPSVRASLSLYERAQAYALLHERKVVTKEDIEASLLSVLSHRIRLKPSVKYLQQPPDFIKEQFAHFAEHHPIHESGDGP
ncbi:ATP-binding protein [Candidatus Woesearchaeota archaeon]|nr:ATP-binding protein [Candidatus Woesearchaeota archaeon]